MARQQIWHNEYWLPLIQIYMTKPQGVKPIYSRQLVDLGMALHIHPQYLHRMMTKLDEVESPSVKALMDSYAHNPKKFRKRVETLRLMQGFGNEQTFYQGVEVVESFEKDFKPLPHCGQISVAQLIMILDLYFQLTPPTMVEQTPEVAEMAKTLKIKPQEVVAALQAFCLCDPCIKNKNFDPTPLLTPCQEVWNRYGSQEQDKISQLACQLKDYFS